MPLLETVEEAYKCHRIKNNFQKDLCWFLVYFVGRFLVMNRKAGDANRDYRTANNLRFICPQECVLTF